jgi:hypothetical protein
MPLQGICFLCLKTVPEPYRVGVFRDLFRAKADTPNYWKPYESVEREGSERIGSHSPKAGALPGCATPRLQFPKILAQMPTPTAPTVPQLSQNDGCLIIRERFDGRNYWGSGGSRCAKGLASRRAPCGEAGARDRPRDAPRPEKSAETSHAKTASSGSRRGFGGYVDRPRIQFVAGARNGR